MSEDKLTETGEYQRKLRYYDPALYWLKRNFTLAPLLTIIALLIGWGWSGISLYIDVLLLRNTTAGQQKEITYIKTTIVPDAGMLGALKEQVAAIDGRVTRVEGVIDYAKKCPPDCDPDDRPRKRKP
jgi:hypothetical protein